MYSITSGVVHDEARNRWHGVRSRSECSVAKHCVTRLVFFSSFSLDWQEKAGSVVNVALS